MRDDNEDAAMEAVRRSRRKGDASLGAQDLQQLGRHFSRIGKSRARSGLAFQHLHYLVKTGALLPVLFKHYCACGCFSPKAHQCRR